MCIITGMRRLMEGGSDHILSMRFHYIALSLQLIRQFLLVIIQK